MQDSSHTEPLLEQEQLEERREKFNKSIRKEHHEQMRAEKRGRIKLSRELMKVVDELKQYFRVNNSSSILSLTEREEVNSLDFLTHLTDIEINTIMVKDCPLISIKSLNNVEFSQLTQLSLSKSAYYSANCMISDDSPIEFSRFPELQNLFLSGNHLTSVLLLSDIPNTLKQVDFNNNRLSSLHSLLQINLKNIKSLDLSHNLIQCLKPLISFDFQNLRTLQLGYNKICQSWPLGRCKFKNLKTLCLDNNHIEDLSFIGKMEIHLLKLLELSFNELYNVREVLRIRKFRHVYFADNDDYYPGIYINNNGLCQEYYGSLGLGNYIVTADNFEEHFEYMMENYCREGESELEGEGGEGGEDGEEGGDEGGEEGGEEGGDEGGQEGGQEGGEEGGQGDGQQQDQEDQYDGQLGQNSNNTEKMEEQQPQRPRTRAYTRKTETSNPPKQTKKQTKNTKRSRRP